MQYRHFSAVKTDLTINMYGVLFTMPAASTTLAGIGAYSSPVFDDFYPILLLLAGVIIPVLAVGLIIMLFRHR